MLFSRDELSLLKNGYFRIIRIEERFVTVQSKNTGHCWMIFKKVLETEKPVVLYHKHNITDEYYHEHKRDWTVAKVIKEIKKHDRYVVDHPNYLKRRKNGHKLA